MENLEKGPAPLQGGLAPPSRISAPEFAEYHMISDYELDRLTNPQSGGLGSFGFMALGTAFGLLPPIGGIWAKAKLQPAPPLELGDVFTIVVFCVLSTLSVLCLGVYFVSRYNNRGLVAKIRSRVKKDLGTTTPS